jgi:hypothetical protein
VSLSLHVLNESINEGVSQSNIILRVNFLGRGYSVCRILHCVHQGVVQCPEQARIAGSDPLDGPHLCGAFVVLGFQAVLAVLFGLCLTNQCGDKTVLGVVKAKARESTGTFGAPAPFVLGTSLGKSLHILVDRRVIAVSATDLDFKLVCVHVKILQS